MIQNDSRDLFGGNVYYVTTQITFLTRKFRNRERNLHCDVVHITTKWVSSLTLDCNGVFAIKAYGHPERQLLEDACRKHSVLPILPRPADKRLPLHHQPRTLPWHLRPHEIQLPLYLTLFSVQLYCQVYSLVIVNCVKSMTDYMVQAIDP